MKLKNDIYTNMISGEIIGFASSDQDFRSMRDDVMTIVEKFKQCNQQNNQNEMDNINANNDNDNCNITASYVNQWRFRSSHNVTASLEFFFNNGSLTGNDLMYQLFHVLSMCNNINIKILGLCLDAGGNNSRLLSLLRHEAKLGNTNWLDDKSLVSF